MFDTPPRHMHAGTSRFDLARRLDEINRVVVVLVDARGDGEDVRVEDDVLGREADLFGEQLVGPSADAHLFAGDGGLALFVESHYHNCRLILSTEPSPAQEFRFAILEADRVDNRLTLDRLQAGFQDRPFAAVDHHRHGRDVVLAGDQP